MDTIGNLKLNPCWSCGKAGKFYFFTAIEAYLLHTLTNDFNLKDNFKLEDIKHDFRVAFNKVLKLLDKDE